MFRITVELLPHGDETKAKLLGIGKICNLRRHEPGSPLGTFHAYFEANEVPMANNPPPYLPDDPRRSLHHLVGDCIVEEFPRYEGSIWDLIATALTKAGRGWPGHAHDLTDHPEA